VSSSFSKFSDLLSIKQMVDRNANAIIGKDGDTSLEELDQFRYIEAPAQFSKKTGRSMDLPDVQKLLEWKL
jgi:hypothetical protein